jgi:hypothetical protein
MLTPRQKQRSLIVGKLRQSRGANYMLCNQAGDEIQLCKKERDECVNFILELMNSSSVLTVSMSEQADALLHKYCKDWS